MSKGIDLELIRDILRDDFNHLELAVVTKIEPAADGSAVYVTADTLPGGREVIGMLAFPGVGHSSGSGDLVDLKDLVLIAFPGHEDDHACIIARFPSGEELLPKQLLEGHMVQIAKPGKKLYLGSDTRIDLSKAVPGTPATEPVPLGLVLQEFMGKMIDRIEKIVDEITAKPVVLSTAPGTPAAISPALAAALAAVKVDLELDRSKYLTTASTNILSQLTFTERGT